MDTSADLAPLFQPDLLRDEKLLWAGQPDPRRIFATGDVFLIPFSIMWGAFALFWEAGVLGLLGGKGQGAPGFFVLWGIPFIVAGQYFIWGRFIYKAWKKRRTYYAVTDRRILVLTTAGTRRLQSMYIQQLPTVDKAARSDGSGSLEFTSAPPWAGFYANSGMEFFGGRNTAGGPAFYDLPDVQAVYDLIVRLKAAA